MSTTTPTISTAYYSDAFRVEFETIWGALPMFKTDATADLPFARALLCWYSDTPGDLVDRFELMKQRFRGVVSLETFTLYAASWPRHTFVPRLLRNVCTLYNEPPQRVFSDGDGGAVDQAFQDLYRRGRVDSAMREVQRLGRLSNVVAVKPEYDNAGRPRLRILPRDMWRVITDEDDETQVRSFWMPYRREMEGQKVRTIFRVWTPESVYEVDHRGNRIADTEIPQDGIPWLIYRRQETSIADPYGSGRLDLIEACMADNLQRVMADRNFTFQGFPIRWSVNLKTGNSIVMGPERVIAVDNLTLGDEPPSLNELDSSSAFALMDEFRRDRRKEIMRDEGIPGFTLDDAGTPPTGIALQVMERELRRNQQEDETAMAEFEHRIAERFARISNQAEGRAIATSLPDNLPAFSIQYADGGVSMEPRDELDLDLAKFKAGLMFPSTLAAKHLGTAEETEQDAAQAIADNLPLVAIAEGRPAAGDIPAPDGQSQLRGSVGGSVLIKELQVAYEAGELSLAAAVANVEIIFGLTPEESSRLFSGAVKQPPPTDAGVAGRATAPISTQAE